MILARAEFERRYEKAMRSPEQIQKGRDAESIAYIREVQPKIREGFKRLAEMRKELGVAPGEPLFGFGEPVS